MLNPVELELLLVQLVLETPEAMEILQSPMAIYALSEPDRAYRDLDEAVRDLSQASVLVAHIATGYGTYGGFQRWQHSFSIFIRSDTLTESWQLAQAIMDGYPARGAGLRFVETQLHECTDLPQSLSAYKTQAEGDIEVVRIDLTYSETGA